MASPTPGRPFPQLPSLTSVPAKHPPISHSQPIDKERDKPTPHEAAAAADKYHESQMSDTCDDDSETGLKPYPDDATFPKHSASFLFADCLSSKNKKYRDGL